MTTLATTVKLVLSSTFTGETGVFTPTASLNNQISAALADADGHFIYSDAVTTVTANKTYDLIGASAVTDPFGVAVDMDVVVMIMIENTDDTNYLHVTGLPAALIKGTTPALIIPPESAICYFSATGAANTGNWTFTGRNAADDANADITWDFCVIGRHVA